MAPQVRRLPHCASGLVALLVLLPGCSSKVTAPLEPPNSVRLADEAFRYGDYEGAISIYHTYLDAGSKDAYTARALYKVALAQYRLGRYEDSLTTLDELAQRYPKGHWVQVDALRGDTYRKLHKPIAALQSWSEAWEIANDTDRRKLRERIVSVSRGLSNMELAQATRTVTSEDVRDLLMVQIAQRQSPGIGEEIPESGELLAEEGGGVKSGETAARATARGNGQLPPLTPRQATLFPTPRSPTAGTGRVEPPASEVPSAAALAAEPGAAEPRAPSIEPEGRGGTQTAPAGALVPPPMAQAAVPPPVEAQAQAHPPAPGHLKVACLLPLSGPWQEIGERSLHGLRTLFGQNSDRLMVMDTGKDAVTAAQLFNQVSRNPDVLAVIGPLRSEDAEALAPLARQAQLPLLLLSQRDGLAGGFVLQAGMTRPRLVAAVLQYAMSKVRIRQFGVLYPVDDTGQQYLASFRSEVAQRGGTIVGVDGYRPRAPELPAVTLKRWRNKDHMQAIFLPDDASAARSVVDFVQRDMPDITLLGVGGWESLAGEGSGVNGILFADGFYSGSRRQGTQQFVNRFQQTYGAAPGALEAQAYDAGLLVQTALDAGAYARARVLPALQAHGPIEGATGRLNVTRTGLERQVFLLQVYDGKLQEVSSAH
jgi:branched-chain amino acid transport system substrate-binding protein